MKKQYVAFSVLLPLVLPAAEIDFNDGWEWRRGEQRSVKNAKPEMSIPVIQRNFLWKD